MDIFQHRLRAIHTRSIQKIMSKPILLSCQSKQKKNKKCDNISTYMRQFDINRQNFNLAKRIHECESVLSRDRYAKEWKKTKNVIRVRSNFKRTLNSTEPRIYKFQTIPGRGNLLIQLTLLKIIPQMNYLQKKNLYTLKIISGSLAIVPKNNFFTIQCQNTQMLFYIPHFMINKNLIGKMSLIIENTIFQKGKFNIEVNEGIQQTSIQSKSGKILGNIQFSMQIKSTKKYHNSNIQDQMKQGHNEKQNQNINQ